MGFGDLEGAMAEPEREGAGIEPSRREPLADPPDVSSQVALSRLARAAVSRLADAGVNVEFHATGDGRVGIIVPFQWGRLLVEKLELEARTFKEQLRRAANQEAIRQAKLRAASGQARREQEEREAAILAEYRRLLAEGVNHRPALHRLKAQWTHLTITELEWIIRSRQVAEEHGRARELSSQGLSKKAIAEQLGMTEGQVAYALRRQPTQERQVTPPTQAPPRPASPPAAPVGPPQPPHMERAAASRVPESPDRLARMWAVAPAPQQESGSDTRQEEGPYGSRDVNRRPFGWDRLLLRREEVGPRMLWAAFARDQAHYCLRWELGERRRERAMRLALHLRYSPKSGMPYAPETLKRYAREIREIEAKPAGISPFDELERELERKKANRRREGLHWFAQRWLPEAEALAQLRAHGVTV